MKVSFYPGAVIILKASKTESRIVCLFPDESPFKGCALIAGIANPVPLTQIKLNRKRKKNERQ